MTVLLITLFSAGAILLVAIGFAYVHVLRERARLTDAERERLASESCRKAATRRPSGSVTAHLRYTGRGRPSPISEDDIL